MLLSLRNNSTLTTAAWCNDLYQSTGSGVTPNSWSFVAVTYDPSLPTAKRKLYINAENVGEDNPPALNTVNSELRIGSTDWPGRTFTGLIDDVRIYSRALIDDELQRLAGVSPYSSACIAP